MIDLTTIFGNQEFEYILAYPSLDKVIQFSNQHLSRKDSLEKLSELCVVKHIIMAEGSDDIKKSIQSLIDIQEMIFHLPDEGKLERAKELLPHFHIKYLQKLIIEAANYNPLSFKTYLELFKCTSPIQIPLSRFSCFTKYLLVNGIASDENFDEDGAPDEWELSTNKKYETHKYLLYSCINY